MSVNNLKKERRKFNEKKKEGREERGRPEIKL